MASTMIRVDEKTHKSLKEMANEEHTSVGQIVADMTKRRKREAFWKAMHESYERLRADPEAWKSYQDDIRAWDATLMDGLEDEPEWDDEDRG